MVRHSGNARIAAHSHVRCNVQCHPARRLWDGCCTGDAASQAVYKGAASAALRQLTRHGGSDDGAAAAVCRLCRRKLRKPAEAQLPSLLLRRCVALLASFVRWAPLILLLVVSWTPTLPPTEVT